MHTSPDNATATESTQTATTTAKAKRTRARSKRARAKKSSVRTVNRGSRSGTKLEAARKIFDRVAGKKSRKDVIAEMVEKADLTSATASAYYQRLAHEPGRKLGQAPRATYERKGGEATKAQIAREIFRRLGGRKQRKDVIAALVKEADLTSAGASTYYQKMKQQAAA